MLDQLFQEFRTMSDLKKSRKQRDGQSAKPPHVLIFYQNLKNIALVNIFPPDQAR